MSSQMIGANTEDLDALAQQLESAADELQRIVEQLKSMPRGVWVGSDATQFFNDLDVTHAIGVGSVGQALRVIGATVRRNASDQRSTSGSLDGGWGTSAGSPAGVVYADSGAVAAQVGDAGAMVEGIVGYGLTAASAIDGLVGSGAIGHFAMGYGVAMDTAHLLENVRDGEWSAATLDALSLASNAGGPLVGALSGIARDSFEMLIPVGSEREIAVVEWAAKQFPDQSIAERYSSPVGLLNMVYDSVSEATENPRNPLTFGIKGAGEGIADVIWAATDGIQDAGEGIADVIWAASR